MKDSSMKAFITDVILESLWGKRFFITSTPKYGRSRTYTAIASKNVKPGELPYRITWFYAGTEPLGHIDLNWDEVNYVLQHQKFPEEILQRIKSKWDAPSMEYRFKFAPQRAINEGMNISISGFDYQNNFKDLHGLTWWLASKVQLPIMKQMTEDEKKQIKNDIIVPDGDDFDKQAGNINVYIGLFPEKWRPMLLGGIQHFLNKQEIKYNDWKVGTSKIYNTQKVTIPITDLNITSEFAPEYSVSYGTAKSIRDALGIGEEYGDEYSFSIKVDDLIRKLKKFRDESNKGLAPTTFAYYKELINMAKWAKEHGYDKISGA